MLLIDRKRNQKIYLGDDIVITVIQTTPNKTRLGIEAPRQLRVSRGELLDNSNGISSRNSNAPPPASPSAPETNKSSSYHPIALKTTQES